MPASVLTKYKGRVGYFTVRYSQVQLHPYGLFKTIKEAKKSVHPGRVYQIVFRTRRSWME